MREIIYLLSTANTGFFYTATRNPKGQSKGKIEVKKYDPIAKKHVMFKESKKLSARKQKEVKPATKKSEGGKAAAKDSKKSKTGEKNVQAAKSENKKTQESQSKKGKM
jgi:large subunit ribosomal protein L33